MLEKQTVTINRLLINDKQQSMRIERQSTIIEGLTKDNTVSVNLVDHQNEKFNQRPLVHVLELFCFGIKISVHFCEKKLSLTFSKINYILKPFFPTVDDERHPTTRCTDPRTDHQRDG